MHNPNLSEVTGNPSSLGSLLQGLGGIRQPGSIGCLSQQAAQEHPSAHIGHSGQGRPCCIPEERSCLPKETCINSDLSRIE